MTRYVTLYVHFHDGQYHGSGGLPSPFRLFQALVAGVGGPLDQATQDALKWLEKLPPPILASPHWEHGKRFKIYVPNNDLDRKEGDVRKISAIRTEKIWQPHYFDPAVPWIYAWPFGDQEDENFARAICALSEKLYQFGRGIDMAWACGEILEEAQLHEKLARYEGIVRKPVGHQGLMLASPCEGSLQSLINRHQHRRFRRHPMGIQKTKIPCRFSFNPRNRISSRLRMGHLLRNTTLNFRRKRDVPHGLLKKFPSLSRPPATLPANG